MGWCGTLPHPHQHVAGRFSSAQSQKRISPTSFVDRETQSISIRFDPTKNDLSSMYDALSNMTSLIFRFELINRNRESKILLDWMKLSGTEWNFQNFPEFTRISQIFPKLNEIYRNRPETNGIYRDLVPISSEAC